MHGLRASLLWFVFLILKRLLLPPSLEIPIIAVFHGRENPGSHPAHHFPHLNRKKWNHSVSLLHFPFIPPSKYQSVLLDLPKQSLHRWFLRFKALRNTNVQETRTKKSPYESYLNVGGLASAVPYRYTGLNKLCVRKHVEYLRKQSLPTLFLMPAKRG
eukprot:g31510.t1